MIPGRRFLAVSAIAAFVLVLFGLSAPTNETGSVSTSTDNVVLAQYPPRINVPCATSGPAKSWPAAGSTKRRNCWWGYEIFLSKNDTKIAAGIVAGAAAPVSAKHIGKDLALKMLAGGAGGGTVAAVNNAIEGGKCLKVTFVGGVAPAPGTYRCT